jgi:hypothetical protein
MIRQRHGFDRLDATAFEGGEKARRMADAGHRHYVRESGDIATFAGKQVNRHPWAQPHRDLPGRATPPLTITASTLCKRDARSRIGPAGSHQPLPKRRTPSITTISVPRQLIVLQPVVGDDNLQIVRAEQRFTASLRSGETATGAPVR